MEGEEERDIDAGDSKAGGDDKDASGSEQDERQQQDAEKDAAQQDEQRRDRSGKWVPKIRLDEVATNLHAAEERLQAEREARVRLEERIKTLETKPAQEKVYTRPELNKLVEAGQITQADADAYIEKQIETRIETRISERLSTEQDQRTYVTRVKEEMARYRELVPDVMKGGSEERTKVKAEYDYLVSIGQPGNVQTELAALRATYGPLDKLEKKMARSNERETFRDSGGGGGGREREAKGADKGGDVTKGLPTRYVNHYQTMIDRGLYKGWDDPRIKSELARLPKETYERRAKKLG